MIIEFLNFLENYWWIAALALSGALAATMFRVDAVSAAEKKRYFIGSAVSSFIAAAIIEPITSLSAYKGAIIGAVSLFGKEIWTALSKAIPNLIIKRSEK